MFLKLDHARFPVFQESRKLVASIYRLTANFPAQERYALVSQIRRAALSVHLNLFEGFSRKSDLERKRFFEIARSSVVELDTAIDIASTLKFYCENEMAEVGGSIKSCFLQLSALIAALLECKIAKK